MDQTMELYKVHPEHLRNAKIVLGHLGWEFSESDSKRFPFVIHNEAGQVAWRGFTIAQACDWACKQSYPHLED